MRLPDEFYEDSESLEAIKEKPINKDLEALKRIKWKLEAEGILGEEYELCDTIEKELKDYQEIKEIAKHYNWDDLANNVFKVETDRKWQLKFESAICDVQEDYRKARVFDIIKVKRVDVSLITDTQSLQEYNEKIPQYVICDKNGVDRLLTQGEYDLLRKALL